MALAFNTQKQDYDDSRILFQDIQFVYYVNVHMCIFHKFHGSYYDVVYVYKQKEILFGMVIWL